jgi:hypothetical protein
VIDPDASTKLIAIALLVLSCATVLRTDSSPGGRVSIGT